MFDEQQPKADPEDIFSGTDPLAGQTMTPGVPAMPKAMPGQEMMDDFPQPDMPQRGSKKLVVFAIVVVTLVIILIAVLIAMWIIRRGQADTVPTSTTLSQDATSLLPINPIPEGTIPDSLSDTLLEEPEDSSLSPEVALEPLQPADTDGDGLTDEEEEALGTNPTLVDSDQDGLNDSEEVRVWNTKPLIADSDGDGFNDGDEVRSGYDPNQAGGVLLDINKVQ